MKIHLQRITKTGFGNIARLACVRDIDIRGLVLPAEEFKQALIDKPGICCKKCSTIFNKLNNIKVIK